MAGLQDTPIRSEHPRPDLTSISHESEQQNWYDVAFGSDDMDVESDGGVSIDDMQIVTSSEPVNELDMLQLKQQYHQTLVTPHDSSTYQWRLPVTPIKHTASTLQNMGLSPIARAYHKHCGLISRHWSSHPDQCIPSELRNLTPYSLSLLCQLRRLASSTKQNLQLAQSMLRQSWQIRYPQGEPLVNPGLVLVETTGTNKRAQGGPGGPWHSNENKIQENELGLMLVDVDRAFNAVKQGKAQQRKAQKMELKNSQQTSRKQKKLARQVAQNANSQLSTVERVTRRRRNDRAAKLAAGNLTTFGDELFDVQIGSSTHQQSRLEDNFAVPPNSPTIMFDQSNAFAPGVALREVTSRHNEQVGSAEQEEEVLYKPSKRDKHQDFMMSRFLDNMDFDKVKQMKKRRLERFQKGGFSRQGHERVVIPSEKSTIDSLPSLQATAPVTDPAELARMGQLSLSDQTPFILPVRSKKVAK